MSRAGGGRGGGALVCCGGMGGPFPEKMIAPTERHHSAIRHSPGSDPPPKSATGGGAISALPGTVAYSRGPQKRGRRSHCVDNHGRKLLPRLLLRERLLAEALAAVIPLAHLKAAPHFLHDIRHACFVPFPHNFLNTTTSSRIESNPLFFCRNAHVNTKVQNSQHQKGEEKRLVHYFIN